MGGRLLKRWLALPLKDINRIKKRHDIVKYFIDKDEFLELSTYQIKQISDIERLVSKVATGKVNPREVVLLKNSLNAIIPIKEAAEKSDNESLRMIGEQLQNCNALREKISKTLNEDAPVNILKGNSIASAASEVGITSGKIYGLGSIIRPRLKGQPQIDSYATELLLTDGHLSDGIAEIEIEVVTLSASQHKGWLEPGANAVCVTAEILVIAD